MVSSKTPGFRDADVRKFPCPTFVVLFVVDEPVLVGSELFDRSIKAHVFDESSRNPGWKKLLGLVEHAPVLDEVLRESGGSRVGCGLLHAGVDFTGNQSSAVHRSLALRKLLLEHFCDSESAELGYTVWSVVGKTRAHGGDGSEEKNAVLLGVGLAEKGVESLSEIQRSVHVNVHDAAPAPLVEVHHHLAWGVDSSVVNEGPEGFSGFLDGGGNSGAALRVADVSDHTNEIALKVHALGKLIGSFESLRVEVHHHNGDTAR
mmetsp:Transcript_17439/g.31309  ORF Transcript_17439/g.31309 Transcript_17439/m.31309 type:complete len:261 (-) Transcript_17439:250-1032(-)|eukprot:CAMPEP_0197523338 /NCGR_PEP_ID=MMETSP1318-20131121/8294_1 /TAXON_ID=552666 /ORGANISM="Partenskyella glossopodia, Strain RCC365" /LENGTH=260 /DNA_ID=CAMNT_0043076005 /DNA_START=304 /DNA_END=1086 /DNA_ORIENTATION=+